jgi:hypothetical protein
MSLPISQLVNLDPISRADIAQAGRIVGLYKDYNKLYNPDVPTLNDINLKPIKDVSRVKLRDRYFTDMKLRNNVRNGDGFTLGKNDSGQLGNFSLDAYLDSNRRLLLDPNNKHMTTPDSRYTGNENNYYFIPPDALVERNDNGLIIKNRLDYSYKGIKNQLE